MSGYFRPREITSTCADYLVVVAVLQNRSPAAEFPGNREGNRELFILSANLVSPCLKKRCGFSALEEKFPKR
jgi:hypothetical protein